MFKITYKDQSSHARLGVLTTPHGVVKTPSYVFVATHGKIRYLTPADIKKVKTQILISNTYHLQEKAPKKITKKTFLTKKLGLNIPTMTDSGGFQVFSLGFGNQNKVGKILSGNAKIIKNIKRKNIKITDKGVYFNIDGIKKYLNPKISMDIQRRIGADIIFAFDECTSPLDSKKYNIEAMKRTHRWAKESLKYHDPKQMLMGIIQGGKYKDLRIKSAKYISSLPFDGIAIGGSFGKDEMTQTLKWIVPHLPDEKFRHLLGIGKVQDVFNAVENGMDLFDCVIPTREARHGRIYTNNGHYDIRKGIYAKTKLHKLFKGDKKQNQEGQRLALLNNILFFNNLLDNIRKSIKKGNFQEFKKEFLAKFNRIQ